MSLLRSASAGVRAGVALVVLAVALSTALPAGAVVRNWNNAAGGSAGTSTNWSPNGVPGAADNLLFNIVGTYTIDFPATVPLVISHAYNTGTVTLTTSAPHATSSSWAVSGANVTSAGANFTINSLFVGNTSYGRLTLGTTGGIPSTPSRWETRDSTQVLIIGNASSGRLDVLGGSQLFSNSNSIFMGNAAASRCTLNVLGRSAFLFQPSLLSTSSATRGNLVAGQLGQSDITVANGGSMRLAGQASLGGSGAGIARMTVSGTTFSGQFVTGGPLRIGGNQFNSTPGGTGQLTVGKGGFVTAGDLVQVGDPDGGGTGTLFMNGGTLVAANGLSKYGNGSVILSGGRLDLTGGRLTWPAGEALTISGPDAPALWIRDGQTNDFVNAPITGLFAGLGAGSGSLRVTAANTVFGTGPGTPCIVGSTDTVACRLEVDSLARFEVGSYLAIATGVLGSAGRTSLSVSGGAQCNAAGRVEFAASATAPVTGVVSGPGSVLRYAQTFDVGGVVPVIGGFTNVLVDSGGSVRDTLAGPSRALVNGPQGWLTVSRGGSFEADTLRVTGHGVLDGGTFAAGRVFVTGGGVFGGRGSVTGTLANSSVVQATGAPGTFGVLSVGGAYSQVSGAKLRLALGRNGARANDTLAVAGAVTFGGTLALEADPSFVYAVGDSYTVVTYASRTGTFEALQWNGNFAGQVFEQVYLPNRLVVVVKAASVGADGGAPLALRFARVAGSPRLALDLPTAADVRVDLFDVTGRRVVTLQQGSLAAGRHEFDAQPGRHGLSSGVYFARASVTTRGVEVTRTVRMPLLR